MAMGFHHSARVHVRGLEQICGKIVALVAIEAESRPRIVGSNRPIGLLRKVEKDPRFGIRRGEGLWTCMKRYCKRISRDSYHKNIINSPSV